MHCFKWDICDSTYRKVQLSEDWILSYGDAKSKYLKICPKANFEITHTLESSTLNLKSYLKDLVQKIVFSCQN